MPPGFFCDPGCKPEIRVDARVAKSGKKKIHLSVSQAVPVGHSRPCPTQSSQLYLTTHVLAPKLGARRVLWRCHALSFLRGRCLKERMGWKLFVCPPSERKIEIWVSLLLPRVGVLCSMLGDPVIFLELPVKFNSILYHHVLSFPTTNTTDSC